MARGSYTLEVPGNALATVTITMTVRDWQLVLKQFKNGGDYPYEANQVITVISEAVHKANAGFFVHVPEEENRNG